MFTGLVKSKQTSKLSPNKFTGKHAVDLCWICSSYEKTADKETNDSDLFKI